MPELQVKVTYQIPAPGHPLKRAKKDTSDIYGTKANNKNELMVMNNN